MVDLEACTIGTCGTYSGAIGYTGQINVLGIFWTLPPKLLPRLGRNSSWINATVAGGMEFRCDRGMAV
jgi:hypothetical protein